jgi:hypothetical protein
MMQKSSPKRKLTLAELMGTARKPSYRELKERKKA